MKNTKLPVVVLLCAFGAACASAPKPLPRRPMSSDEAIQRGLEFCHHRQFACDVRDADLIDNRVWKVNFNATNGVLRGILHVEFDAMSRNLLGAQEPAPPPPPARPAAMNSDEATRRGLDYCRSRGLSCQMRDLDLANGVVWKLNLNVSGNPQGRLHLEFDAYSRVLRDVNEDLHAY